MSITTSTSARLKHLRSSISLTQKKFAETLKCSQGKVSDYESGKLSVSNDDLVIIANAYNVNLNWLLTGTGPMFLDNSTRTREKALPLITLPVVADIAAGIGIEADAVEPTEFITLPASYLALPGPYYCFRVSGISMEPELHTGDHAIVAAYRFDEDYNGSICAFRSVDGLLIKRLVHDHRRKKALLIPLNPSQKPMDYDENSPEIILIGRLAAIIRTYS